MTTADPVAELVAEGRLERIRPDRAAIERMLRQASLNLQGAQRELEARNPGGAYALMWDGLRQAIAAHMASAGMRATSRPGHHAAVTTYAASRLPSVAAPTDLDALDRMRRTRNLTEYGAQPVPFAQVEADLVVARRVARAIIGALVTDRRSAQP